jgi:hypothetical protein
MKRLLLISFFIFPFVALSQKQIDKSSIIESERHFEAKKLKRYLDSGLTKRDIYLTDEINEYVKMLEKQSIDTIGVYLIYYTGYESMDTCKCCDRDWVAYIQWTNNGKTFHKHLHQHHKLLKQYKYCNFDSVRIENSVLIDYYSSLKEKLKNEIVMPVTNIELNESTNEYDYFTTLIDHTAFYTIYCKLDNDSHIIEFDLFRLETKESIFYEDNQNLLTISWWKLLENQIKEIENN